MILHDIVTAVNDCHNAKICHLDISSDNLICLKGVRTKLIDFGVAQKCENLDSVVNCRSGKPGYLPPEYFVSDSYSGFKRDIWDIGAVTFLLFSRKPLVSDEVKLQRRLLSKSFQSYCDIYCKSALRWPKDLLDFVTRCLDPDPQKRPSAKELVTHPLFKNLRRSYISRVKNWTYKMESSMGVRRTRVSNPTTPTTPSKEVIFESPKS